MTIPAPMLFQNEVASLTRSLRCNIEIVELRQGHKIACLEEVALNIDQVIAQAEPIANSEYGRYLLQLAEPFHGYHRN